MIYCCLTSISMNWCFNKFGYAVHMHPSHYNDVIMGAVASQITSLTIVYSIVYSDADHRKHQSSASLAFVRRIHRGPVNSPHKWPVTRKMLPFDDVIMLLIFGALYSCTIDLTIDLMLKDLTNMRRPCHQEFRTLCMHISYYLFSQKTDTNQSYVTTSQQITLYQYVCAFLENRMYLFHSYILTKIAII